LLLLLLLLLNHINLGHPARLLSTDKHLQCTFILGKEIRFPK